MILNLCYLCPPLAVALMGRPFATILTVFATLWFWKPGVRLALTHYADYMGHKHVGNLTSATHNPAWTRGTQPRRDVESTPMIDDPQVGAKGTYFKRK